jgi:hypothetical protein
MWIFDGAANGTIAASPFSNHERQTLDAHGAAFTSDLHYFASRPGEQFAIRRACLEFDWVTEYGEVPAPPIYVLVSKLRRGTHLVTPIYRGVPFWPEKTFGLGRYAAIEHGCEAFDIVVRCHAMNGMNDEARAQFDQHNLYVQHRRAFALASRVSRKVVN